MFCLICFWRYTYFGYFFEIVFFSPRVLEQTQVWLKKDGLSWIHLVGCFFLGDLDGLLFFFFPGFLGLFVLGLSDLGLKAWFVTWACLKGLLGLLFFECQILLSTVFLVLLFVS